MIDLNTDIIAQKWRKLEKTVKEDFDKNMDINAALFLIGVQELGIGFQNFSKEEKQDLMHIANCRVLSFSGYYELEGKDQDGWPHWKKVKEIPKLSLEEQDLFLKHHIILYFSDIYEL